MCNIAFNPDFKELSKEPSKEPSKEALKGPYKEVSKEEAGNRGNIAMVTSTSHYPFIPEERVSKALLEKASSLVKLSQSAAAKAAGPLSTALPPLLRSMNSYYSNKIEGQHTTPRKIENALNQQFSKDSSEHEKQLLSNAHIETELKLETEFAEATPLSWFTEDRVRLIHKYFFDAVPDSMRVVKGNKKEEIPVAPGEYRTRDVDVGRYLPPETAMVKSLMREWEAGYQRTIGLEKLIVATACAHHRLVWVHPFLDGNGRVSRLQAHLVLRSLGLTSGIWSPLRGLARTQEKYYQLLRNADLPPRNSYDGRGPLSQEELVTFADYFLEVCIDQAKFMDSMLNLNGIRGRIKDLLLYLENNPWTMGSEKSVIKPEKTALAMEFVAMQRPLERSEFVRIIGESDVTSRRIIRSLLSFGVLRSQSSRDKLEFALPLESLRFLFPRLWPEADAETAS